MDLSPLTAAARQVSRYRDGASLTPRAATHRSTITGPLAKRMRLAPHAPDAWMDQDMDRIGYKINFDRHFHRYTPPRPLEETDVELKEAEEEITRLLREVTE